MKSRRIPTYQFCYLQGPWALLHEPLQAVHWPGDKQVAADPVWDRSKDHAHRSHLQFRHHGEGVAVLEGPMQRAQ